MTADPQPASAAGELPEYRIESRESEFHGLSEKEIRVVGQEGQIFQATTFRYEGVEKLLVRANVGREALSLFGTVEAMRQAAFDFRMCQMLRGSNLLPQVKDKP